MLRESDNKIRGSPVSSFPAGGPTHRRAGGSAEPGGVAKADPPVRTVLAVPAPRGYRRGVGPGVSPPFRPFHPVPDMLRRRHALAALCLLLVTAPSARGQAAGEPGAEAPDLRRELLAMETADQEARNELMAGIGPDGRPDSSDVRRVREVDAANTVRLREIVAEHGWPTAELVGEDGVHAAFLLVQHTRDRAFQARMLPHIERSWREGALDGQAYALLLDRVRVRRGEPQVYGTQMKPMEEWEDGEPVPHPIEDRASVDERRAEVGLPPLSQYVEMLKEHLEEARGGRGG